MRQFSSDFLPASTMTLLSGFVIIFATTLALGSMTRDQTGYSIASVSMAFRTELNGDIRDFEVIPVSAADPFVPVTSPPVVENRFTILPRPESPGNDRTDEFRNLLLELRRIAGNATVSQPFREVTIDLFCAADPESGRQIDEFSEACDVLDSLPPSAASLQFEIRKWAASPTNAAWIDSVHSASVLRSKLQAHWKATRSTPIGISSSATLWPHADRLRPELTIFVRHIAPDHSDVSVPSRLRRN